MKGFGRPAGVRKSPRKEPAGHRRWLWGFRSAADVGNCATAPGKRGDGCGQAASLCLSAMLAARSWAGRAPVGICQCRGHAWIRCRRLYACGLKLEYAMPDHGAVSRFVAGLSGGPRGCLQRSNTSMTIMRPPQHGHGGRKSCGSPDVSSSGGAATSRSSRASARLALRAEPASRP